MNSVSEIRPVTRVEGHGSITVQREGERIRNVTLSLYESPRLFEALLVGKRFDELPEIICRICSLCSTVHRTCSLLAIEKAFGIEVSEQTRLYRELIVNGGHIESHALHLFCLALPDLLGVDGFPGLAAKAPDELRLGLRIKAAGNLIQETVGGRLIHPVTLIPGGMGKPVDGDGLRKLRDVLLDIRPDLDKALALFADASSPLDRFHLLAPRFLAVQQGDAPPLFGESLLFEPGDVVPAEIYRQTLRERVVTHSHGKQSMPAGEPVTVGALARLNLGLELAPQALPVFRECVPLLTGRDIRANNLAQAVELIHATGRSLEIIELILARAFQREPPVDITPRTGIAAAAIEAPRGVLIHSYGFDGRGICTSADIVTPTAINQLAMERDLLFLAGQLEDADDEEMAHLLECLVRAYDPCISCAVHVVRR